MTVFRPREQGKKAWCALLPEFGSKSTAYNRFREWVEHGCLQKAWAVLLQEYDQVLGIVWQWQSE